MHCLAAFYEAYTNVLKVHTMLGTVCDEHEDDTVQFCGGVIVGVGKIIPSPNLTFRQMMNYEREDLNCRICIK